VQGSNIAPSKIDKAYDKNDATFLINTVESAELKICARQ
jgi:hypothetical protein